MYLVIFFWEGVVFGSLDNSSLSVSEIVSKRLVADGVSGCEMLEIRDTFNSCCVSISSSFEDVCR